AAGGSDDKPGGPYIAPTRLPEPVDAPHKVRRRRGRVRAERPVRGHRAGTARPFRAGDRSARHDRRRLPDAAADWTGLPQRRMLLHPSDGSRVAVLADTAAGRTWAGVD